MCCNLFSFSWSGRFQWQSQWNTSAPQFFFFSLLFFFFLTFPLTLTLKKSKVNSIWSCINSEEGGKGCAAREVRASGGAFTGGSTPHLQPMMSPMMFMMVKMLMLAIVWMLKIPSDSVVGQLNKDKIQGVFFSVVPPLNFPSTKMLI